MLFDYFKHRNHARTDNIALSFDSHTITSGDLFARADLIASSLYNAGIMSGELVVVSLPNCAEFAYVMLALWKLNAAAALASVKYGSAERDALSKQLPFRYVITNTDFAQQWMQGNNNWIKLSNTLTLLKVQLPKANTMPFANLAAVKFSSGTTGVPKAVALTGENIIAETEGIISGLAVTSSDKILCATPLSHSYGFDLGFLAMLGSGATLYVREQFIPRLTMREIAQNSISIFLGVPSMYRAWCETQMSELPSLQSIRYMLSCTAPLSTSVITRFTERFGVPICQHYGSSETGAVCTHTPQQVNAKPHSVGRAMPHVSIRIVDSNDNPVPNGTEGELVVSGKAISPGYLMGAPTERTTLGNGEFRTGDLGSCDNEGYITINSRIDSCINVGGFKVAPAEIITVLESHPAVYEATAAGKTDDSGETWVYAAVSVRTEIPEAELISFCRDHLAEYKTPRRIEIMRELPHTANGKITLKP